VVDQIKEQRPEKHRDKPIYPFKILPYGVNRATGECKVSLPISSTNPSDPNSIKDLGPLIFVNPEELQVNNIEEQFSESQFDQLTQHNAELDAEIDENDALNYIEGLKDDDARSQISKKSRLTNASQKSARMKDNEQKERVKALIRRGEELRSETKSIKSNRSKSSARLQTRQDSNRLIKKMEDNLAEENGVETRSNRSGNSGMKSNRENPLLKQASVRENLVAKSVSSNKSLVSNTSLGKYVRSLKGELERERNVKDKAISILKDLKKQNNNSNIDEFLRTFTN